MYANRFRPLVLFLLLILTAHPCGVTAQERITTPLEQFGHQIGDDYFLANYAQLQEYWEKLAGESERIILESIGRTEQGRNQLMAIITSPANHRNLFRYKELASRLAKAQGVSEEEARALAEEGKSVVWIDGGLHASEVVGAQQLIELVYRMASRNDPETMRILDDVILLAVLCNPDGMDLVSNWYMRNPDPQERSTRGLPVLYHKYAGHDNNRDSYMANLIETESMNRVMYREWFPQIIYNHHQTGPAGTVIFAPPFRDPPNHNLDPLILTSLEQVGSAMHHRFVQEGKGGSTMRSGAHYSIWWNGGQRTTPYYKNMIGLLTEIIGNPTPMEIPYIPGRQISSNDLPLPVEPGVWHMRQSIEYSMTADMAVLDYASRFRDTLLFNIWCMGANSTERGSRDSWTILPKQIDAESERLQSGRGDRQDWERGLRDPANRDARGFVIPSDQADFPTATKFVNALLKNGVSVLRATEDFRLEERDYPAGSYVVKTAQAFRPHVLDMFEPQNHPNDFAYPGAPPTAPYDNAGWTLAYQMAVEFDRIAEGFDGPFVPIEGLAEPPAGTISGPADARGFLLSHEVNDSFIAVNRLLANGKDVYWLKETVRAGDRGFPEGTFYIPAGSDVRSMLEGMAGELGLNFTGVTRRPSGRALKLRPVRIGLWDRYGGSMPSGWVRLILERFEFDFELVFPPELDKGDLNAKFDVLIFPDGAIPGTGGRSAGRRGGGGQTSLEGIPPEYRDRIGSVSAATTVPRIEEFIRMGGTVIAEGSSTNLGYHLGLPIKNHLVEEVEGGVEQPLRSQKYFVPGSVLEVKLEHVSPVTHGLGERVDVLFSRSPVLRLPADADRQGVRRIGWFDTPEPLRSGWAWGQHYLENGSVLLEAAIGEGKVFLFTPRVTFRAQSHGTFPLVFNAIYYGTAEPSADGNRIVNR